MRVTAGKPLRSFYFLWSLCIGPDLYKTKSYCKQLNKGITYQDFCENIGTLHFIVDPSCYGPIYMNAYHSGCILMLNAKPAAVVMFVMEVNA